MRLWDGTVVQNLTGLCWRHHNDVTENRAEIRLTESHNFIWVEDGGSEDQPSATAFFLTFQPKIWGVTSDAPDEPAQEHVHAPGAVETCPECHRALPRPKAKREPTKARASWTITVPKEERENGAEVLDTLLEEAAKICGHDQENDKTKYHSLAFALGMFVMHSEELFSDE